MRSGVRALDRADARAQDPANLLLFCDPDVVFRDPTTLGTLATQAHEARAAPPTEDAKVLPTGASNPANVWCWPTSRDRA